jgi:hypothetical protein
MPTRKTAALMNDPVFAPFFTAWADPWEFADAETAARRLTAAGFDEVRTSLESTPVVQPDATALAAFLTSVICRPHLARLPAEAHAMFVGELTRQAAGDDAAFELDDWPQHRGAEVRLTSPALALFELLESSRPIVPHQSRQ